MAGSNPRARRGQSLNDRARENIKLVKVLRGISDEEIAKAGFTSRQVVADRVNGRTPLSLDDVDRFARALGVNRDALIGTSAQLMTWIQENSDIADQDSVELPPMKGRVTKKAAPKRAPVKAGPRKRTR